MGRDDDVEDPATEAFEDLREEVAELRSTIEAFPRRVRVKAPDYTPTLAAIQKTLESIQAHPALQLTPERYASEARAVVQALRGQIEKPLLQAANDVTQASGEIRRFAGELRTREEQRIGMVYAAAAGLGAGIVLWALAAGPILGALPASWEIPERMAAATLDLDRWAAGSRLMKSADSTAWNNLIAASNLVSGNANALTACHQAAEELQKPQTCRIRVQPGRPDPNR